jgi:hypothetical protein
MMILSYYSENLVANDSDIVGLGGIGIRLLK